MILSDKEKEFVSVYEYIMGRPFYAEFENFTPADFHSLAKANYQNARNELNGNISFMEEEMKRILKIEVQTNPFI